MAFEPGQRVVAAVEGLGPLQGTIVRDTAEPGAPDPAPGSPRIYVVRWTLEDGSEIANTAAETALRPAD
ncbi:hypothetical protein AB0L40_25575 [Patulibacter sp. NPDC049589]|uniref:hypothetical protein n=1 Tax=Patulibacter sp. NPDC049589 TaxID=3154731 RepID=UPI003422440B